MNKADFSVILLAAGAGRRMKAEKNKNLLDIAGQPAICYCLGALRAAGVSEMVLVTNEEDVPWFIKVVIQYGFDQAKVITGGKERYDSVMAGLAAVTKPYVLIHDGARMLVTPDIIIRCIEGVEKYKAVIAAVPAKDTIKLQKKEKAENPVIEGTPDRTRLWQAQTPQAFSTELIKEGYHQAKMKGIISNITDDAQTVELLGRDVHLVMGDYTNIKITEKSDLIFAEAVVRSRERQKSL